MGGGWGLEIKGAGSLEVGGGGLELEGGYNLKDIFRFFFRGSRIRMLSGR